MKIFKFFISKIFLRKAILGIAMILLLFMANYTTFTAARSVLSTFQGYQETKYINQDGIYIANLDPYSPIDMGMIDKSGTQAVYDYLNNNLITHFIQTDSWYLYLTLMIWKYPWAI